MSKRKLLIDPIEIKVDINQLIRSGLSIEEFFVCTLINDNKIHQLKYYEKIIGEIPQNVYTSLVLKGYCKYTITNEKYKIKSNYLSVTDLFKSVLVKNKDIIDHWIDDWMKLWPKGVTSGGYYIRGDKRSARYKMKLFRKSYPEYSREIIFEATRRYVMRMAVENYKYSKLSHYFIYKDAVSTLAAECEALDGESLNMETTNYGETEL